MQDIHAKAPRRRDPSEFFGLERQLWDDRHDGQLRKDWIAKMRRAELQLAVAMDAGNPREDFRLMRDALRAAQDTLAAAGQAMAGRSMPAAGTNFGATCEKPRHPSYRPHKDPPGRPHRLPTDPDTHHLQSLQEYVAWSPKPSAPPMPPTPTPGPRPRWVAIPRP